MKNQISNTDLKKIILFFNTIEKDIYCLIKKPSSFPIFQVGSDLDIVVDNIELFEEKIKKYFQNLDTLKLSKSSKGFGKVHFDILKNDNLLIRFDTYFDKPETGDIYLKKNFYDHIFNNIYDFKFFFDDESYKIKVPKLKFEILIRIIEFNLYPSKVHHKLFLKENLNEVKAHSDFINQYIDVEITKLLKSKFFINKIKNFMYKIKKRLRLFFLYNSFLESIFLKPLSFTRIEENVIDIGWMNVITSSSIIVPINKLKVNLKNSTGIEKSKIEDTPHFKFINSYKNNLNLNKDAYQDYLIRNFSEISNNNVENHTNNFIYLYEEYEKMPGIFELVVFRDKDLFLKNSPTLLDGVHRLSIMKTFDQEYVKCFISDVK